MVTSVNTNNYVNTTTNNSNLIPVSSTADYPLIVSASGLQTLTSLIVPYVYGSSLLTFYSAQDYYSAISSNLTNVFSQTVSVSQVGGIDLITNYKITFGASVTNPFGTNGTIVIQWLDADNGVFTTLTPSTSDVSSIATLATYINTNISTVTASVLGQVLTIVADASPTANQLVRIEFTGLTYTNYIFSPDLNEDDEPVNADFTAVMNALISSQANEIFINYYALLIESNLYFAELEDSDSVKIGYQKEVIDFVESTPPETAGDNTKIAILSSNDQNIVDDEVETDIMSYAKSINVERSLVAYYTGNDMVSSITSFSFGLNNGDRPWSYLTAQKITYLYLTQSYINAIYQLDNNGNLLDTCKNGNYYNLSGGVSFFYPGVTGSGLPFDVTILSDHIAQDCRDAQIQSANTAANSGTPIPYDQDGINIQVAVIRGVMNDYLANGKTQYIDDNGNSCTIVAPTFDQIKASPTLSNQFKNRVLTGISIYYAPAGTINKVYETFVAVI